jgi:uncharacterized surface protein with fasciclin (FAS1) repeats
MMKQVKYIGFMMMAAGMLTATSCTDFSDYNEVVPDANPTGDRTLWENILQNSELSDFAALVQKTGFNENLNSAHYYTVWAPLNGQFQKSDYENMSTSELLHKFVKNHIAEYGHSASGKIEERVLMLNDKSYDFVGAGSYSFNNLAIQQANMPSSNGLIHTMKGAAVFYPNLYEYLTDSVEASKVGLDSLSAYFRSKESTYLDEDLSVKGPIVDGKVTYIDSVIVKTNSLTRRLHADFENEDSSYTMLLPTNTAWTKGRNAAASRFNYIAQTKAEKFVDVAGTISISPDPATKDIDAGEWKDSLTHSYLVSYLTYSNGDEYNKWLNGGTSIYGTDTLRATTYAKLSGAQNILKQQISTVKMSNGVGLLVDSLDFRSWETYEPELLFPAYSSWYRARILSGTPTRIEVIDPSMEDGGYSYLEVKAPSQYAKPELDLYLPDVQSTTYDFYCVFVPNFSSAERLPNRVIFTLSYCDENGELKTHEFLDESQENIDAFQAEFNLADNATNKTTIRAFSNDASKLDTLYLGEFTFPVSYAGLTDYSKDEYICPNIKITSPFSVFNAKLRAAFSRDLCIAAIILKPKKLVEYEESNK